MQIFRMVLFLILFLHAFCVASAMQVFDYVTYYMTTDQMVTAAWDASEGAEKYEIRLYCHERNEHLPIGETTECQITFQLPRSGHYIAQVRALCTGGGSDWAESTNIEHAAVNGQPRAWWLYGYLDPPGPIIPF